MSPHLHYQIARDRQQEILSRAINSHRSDVRRPAVNRHRTVKHRVAQVAAALGACIAAGTAVAATDVHSNQSAIRQPARHVSAQRLDREIRAFEKKGYVPTSCTVSGTLMRNYRTGQSVTVKW
jgi:hypothetical protein